MVDPFVQLPAVEVRLHGTPVAAVAMDPNLGVPVFEYFPSWLETGPNLASIVLPFERRPQTFPSLERTSFRGLPGLLADSLPGTFADLLTNAWLARHGISTGQITPVDRLGYIGERGTGALTFHPAIRDDLRTSPTVVDIGEAADASRRAINGTLRPDEAGDTLGHLLDISGSAGGARAKAAIALGPDDEVRSGQHDAPDGFTHWLIKFDVAPGQLPGATTGLGQVELAYHRMALDAGLEMTECRVLEVNGSSHFLTRRFDRPGPSARVHVQSLAAMAHLPPEHPGAHSYEQFLQTCLALDLSAADRRRAFRQVVFNIAAAVRDDHTKNVAFLHDGDRWCLAPAFDVTFPFLDGGGVLPRHQMTVDGSVHGADAATLLVLGERAKVPDPDTVIDEVRRAVLRWPDHADGARVLPSHRAVVDDVLRATALAR